MSCTSCGSGSKTKDGLPAGCANNGACGVGGCNKLSVFDWLANMSIPADQKLDIIEIRFKNGRKEFFRDVNNLFPVVGEAVAVEASPGHDMGVVSATGELVRLQMRKKGISPTQPDIKKLYRKAKQTDIDKWREAQALEEKTMQRARTLAVQMGLQMKISDVEYQGDKTKCIFYYTADERVDFRQLIKAYAEEFRVRIEMKQIGARQEASRLGGIGSCGRELCCSTWLTDFRTVSTSAARYQQLSLNPQKLAGQCGKLKCCLNYELDSYMDALKDFPEINDVKLKSKKGEAVHQKTDIFKRMMWFSYTSDMGTFIPLKVDRVKEVIELNKKGELPEELINFTNQPEQKPVKEPDYENVVGQDSLTRFDKKKNNNNNRRNNNNRPGNKNAKKPMHAKGANPNNRNKPNNKLNPNKPNTNRPTHNRNRGAGPNKPKPE
jgi:cell fate regulator YaaT (PSP1 superfamily)